MTDLDLLKTKLEEKPYLDREDSRTGQILMEMPDYGWDMISEGTRIRLKVVLDTTDKSGYLLYRGPHDPREIFIGKAASFIRAAATQKVDQLYDADPVTVVTLMSVEVESPMFPPIKARQATSTEIVMVHGSIEESFSGKRRTTW
jgi:hypothetical protein